MSALRASGLEIEVYQGLTAVAIFFGACYALTDISTRQLCL
jgi:hypothetical protein